jgi:hypothetical protein
LLSWSHRVTDTNPNAGIRVDNPELFEQLLLSKQLHITTVRTLVSVDRELWGCDQPTEPA